jgi:Tfp pilus assembly protein PilO
MNKLSKEKRKQLVLAVITTVAVVAGLYGTLIRYQQAGLERLTAEKVRVDSELKQIKDTFDNGKQIKTELAVVSSGLQTQEKEMASGDLYSSMIAFVTAFKKDYLVDIPQFNSGGTATDVNLLPKFPYKQVTISIAGTAFFFDVGKFVADFENKFPSARILNLELSPAAVQSTTQNSDDKEKLSFRMDIVSLVKTGSTPPAAKTQ